MPSFVDLSGRRFGRLMAQERAPTVNRRTRWLCGCDCGKSIVVRQDHLGDGHVRSCGCLYDESRLESRIGEISRTHGMRYTVEYKAYVGAKGRCENERHAMWHGRGIEFRFGSFEAFFAALGPKPLWARSVDRINNDGHYEEGNVRWATAKEQALNTRRNLPVDSVKKIRRLYAGGYSPSRLSEIFGCSRHHIHQLVNGKARRDVKD